MPQIKRKRNISYCSTEFGFKVEFNAMASPCELLINSTDRNIAIRVGEAVSNEAWRIEDKYSRYLSSSICSKINTSNGQAVPIDAETYKLLDFAKQCFLISDGAFDITSGVLRQAWKFDGRARIPKQNQISTLLPKVGFNKISLTQDSITLESGMEIDLGGLGKEYAVDTSLLLAKKLTNIPILINFGGDVAASSPQLTGQPWHVGIEHPGFEDKQPFIVSISAGAIATSGEARRFLSKNGQRYSHILNPKTGWSVLNAPKSITVAAPNCIQAGFIATLALLQGENAEDFLKKQNIDHWCIW
ncbi:FAD:protein FMN transferase [Thalassotalea psychrophila]|uniref:FAD:protein FMN transferase n=1 Tax=Thalassotalea psychrophila TaxID=3065647 RepID=A0ABY9TQB9_9GAMM|nr:FAD:protein FMN transferase [Colwelliaceae bacterium SQ149]